MEPCCCVLPQRQGKRVQKILAKDRLFDVLLVYKPLVSLFALPCVEGTKSGPIVNETLQHNAGCVGVFLLDCGCLSETPPDGPLNCFADRVRVGPHYLDNTGKKEYLRSTPPFSSCAVRYLLLQRQGWQVRITC